MMDDRDPRLNDGMDDIDNDIDAAMDVLGPRSDRPAVSDRMGQRGVSGRFPVIATGRNIPVARPVAPAPPNAPTANQPPIMPPSTRGRRVARPSVNVGRGDARRPPLPNVVDDGSQRIGDSSEVSVDALSSSERHAVVAAENPFSDFAQDINDDFAMDEGLEEIEAPEASEAILNHLNDESSDVHEVEHEASFELYADSAFGLAEVDIQNETEPPVFEAVEAEDKLETSDGADHDVDFSEVSEDAEHEALSHLNADGDIVSEHAQAAMSSDGHAVISDVYALVEDAPVQENLHLESSYGLTEHSDKQKQMGFDNAQDKAAAFEIKPIPAELRHEQYLRDYGAYRTLTRSLMRSQNWAQLAEMMQNALTYALWADLPEVRSSILVELVGIYSDRMADKDKEFETYTQLLSENPANPLALDYMQAYHESRNDYLKIHDMYRRVVSATWETEGRIHYTQKAADIAELSLKDPDLAIADWEHLWAIGDQGIEVQGALMTTYRRHERWEKLADFLSKTCVNWGEMKRLGQREVVEIYITGLEDAQRAQAMLDVLIEERPKDPLLLLQAVNVCRLNNDIDKLAALSRISNLGVNSNRDIQRAAAEVLWDKGEHELAVQAYDALLDQLPDDRDALNAKEQYYQQSGNNELLCQFYENRAQRALQDGRKQEGIEFLNKAVVVSESALDDLERAVTLCKNIINVDAEDIAAYNKLVELYEAMDNPQGVADSLEKLLPLTSQPAAKRDLLARLGTIYLEKLENFEKAEVCWLKVKSLDPRNPEVSEELSRVYAKQGDYDALDKSLTQQMRVAQSEHVQDLAISKGRYLMQQSPASSHTAAGWEIVLDYDPNHTQSLESFSEVAESLHREKVMIAAWEQALVSIEDKEEKISLALRIADACVSHASHTQALSAYLRVLCWSPTQAMALDALEAICNEEESGIVVAVLEVAATLAESKEERCRILRKTLRFISKDKVQQRITVMRRLLVLGDRSISGQLSEICENKEYGVDSFSAFMRIAYESEDKEEIESAFAKIIALDEEILENPSRAFTILFAVALDPQKAQSLLTELERLAPLTKRWEEVVAVLGCISTTAFPAETRREAIEKRIDIFSQHLESPARVMEELRRLIGMYPEDESLLERAETVAKENDLHEALIGIYGELWDATESPELRAAISRKRYHVYKNVLKRNDDALHELFLAYRFAPTDELDEEIKAEATEAAVAALCVPLLESQQRAKDDIDADALKSIAKIYTSVLSSKEGAYDIYCNILRRCPSDDEALTKMGEIVKEIEGKERYAFSLRLAASHAYRLGLEERSLELYRLLANYYRDSLEDIERCIDIERRILRIDSDCIVSLEALIAWHESREEWPDLRSELKQRIAATPSVESNVDLWLRIADISRNKLNDLEGAFDAYAEILQIDETNEIARAGIAELTGSDIGPEVELRRLKLELKLAESSKRPELMLGIAKLLAGELGQLEAASEMLERLYVETGAQGIGYEPLLKMYERQKSWANMVKIMLEHAEYLSAEGDDVGAITTLNQALVIVDTKTDDKALATTIIERLRVFDPDDEAVFERYCAILRRAEDWTQYTKVITPAKHGKEITARQKSQLFELARMQILDAEQHKEAVQSYQAINRAGVEKNAYFGIASVGLKIGDIDMYLNALDQVLRIFDPAWGAIFYCHMAEVCDEKEKPNQVANYYRNARMLDPNNVVASESLRSIGRRLKNWRQSSAILPVENEHLLSWAERSDRLLELAQKSQDVDEARLWLWKSIAVSHQNIKAWQALAELETKAERYEQQFEARLGALGAFEQSHLPSQANSLKNAQLLHDVALAAIADGKYAKAETLYRKAYTIAPNYAPVAIAVGELEQESGNLDKAYAIYDAILKDEHANIDEATHSDVLFKRGLIANIQQNYELALDDLRTTVKRSPLHLEALAAISKTYTETQHPLLALYYLQKSLLVTPDHTVRRGGILYNMGMLWSDAFEDVAEAGIYFEGALDNGASNVDLIERSLEIYKQAGRYREALELVDTLTQKTTDPRILASLWSTRGELSESISIDAATEAYDMALSYTPGLSRALDGLERTLVARQEWPQLAELLEGRLEGELSVEQEAAILLRLADLYSSKLSQADKAQEILYRILDAAPSNEVVLKLLEICPHDDVDKRMQLLEKAVTYCDGRYLYAMQMAEIYLQRGREAQAWAIYSPLRVLLQVETKLKEVLNDLKTKFEKSDANTYDKLSEAMPKLSDEQFVLLDALRAVDEKLGSLGPKTIDDITSGATEITEFTPNGKTFYQMREALGIENATLWRATDLPEAIVVVRGPQTVVCIRTEIFQKAAGNELQFWLAKGLGLAHPDVQTIAATPMQLRHVLPKAILAATGIAPQTPDTASLVARIKEAVGEDELRAIHSQLSLYETNKLLKTADTLAQDLMDSSDILGAFTVADMRTVWRAETRVDSDIPEQRSIKTIDEINQAIESSSILKRILASYVTPAFGDLLA